MLHLQVKSEELESAILNFLEQYTEQSNTLIVVERAPTPSALTLVHPVQGSNGHAAEPTTEPSTIREYVRSVVRTVGHPLSTGEVYKAVKQRRGSTKRQSIYNALRLERLEGKVVHLNDGTWAPAPIAA